MLSQHNADTRYVYGATCTWNGPIQEVSTRSSLPCCPKCRGMLLQVSDVPNWQRAIDQFDAEHPGYAAFISRRRRARSMRDQSWNSDVLGRQGKRDGGKNDCVSAA